MPRDPLGALRSILASVEAAPDGHAAQVFQQYCGPVALVYGCYRAKGCRIVGISPDSPELAVRAWARKARANLTAADVEAEQ